MLDSIDDAIERTEEVIAATERLRDACSTSSSPEASPVATRSGSKSEASAPSPPAGTSCGWGTLAAGCLAEPPAKVIPSFGQGRYLG